MTVHIYQATHIHMLIKQTLKNIIAPKRKIYTEKKVCRCCGIGELKQYANLGSQPLANNLTSKRTVPLEVVKCNFCHNSQLSVVVDPTEMFDDYLFVSGTAQSHIDHFNKLAKYAFNIAYNQIDGDYNDLEPSMVNVLDIACNNGTLLDEFVKLGCTVHGVDPAKNLRKYTKAKKIPVDVKYWDNKIAKKYENKFNIITAVNVFAHVDDSLSFLINCRTALKENGIVVIEFPYNLNLIFQHQFDTVYHEHLNYFLVNSFNCLISTTAAFTIKNVSLNNSYGGSIRFVLTPGPFQPNEAVQALIEVEKQLGLFNISTYEKSFSQFTQTQNDILNCLRHRDEINIGYGAAAKTTVFLNTQNVKDGFKNEGCHIDFIIDDNKLKQGHKVPGTKIPIKDISYLDEILSNVDSVGKNINIIVFSWNFYDDIKKKMNERFEGNDFNFVRYVPNLIVE